MIFQMPMSEDELNILIYKLDFKFNQIFKFIEFIRALA